MANSNLPVSGSGVIPLTVRDKETLYKCYMPFLADGGLFVPTNRRFELGDEVFVLLTLPDEDRRYPVTGRVVWINAKAAAGRPTGIGIHFTGEQSMVVQKRIEILLGGTENAERPRFTM